MSTTNVLAGQEIELLDRVLFRLGAADTDEKLEVTLAKFLGPVLKKIESSNESVRSKVMELLTHVNIRLKSRPLIKLPIEEILDQYCQTESFFLPNFQLIYLTLGYPRLPKDDQIRLLPKLFFSTEKKVEAHKDKILLMILQLLDDICSETVREKRFLDSTKCPDMKKRLLGLFHDVLLLPYGITEDAEVPPGLSPAAFKRIIENKWKAEELEKLKKGIVKFVTNWDLNNTEIFILLVIASSDTRFSVATPAIAELSKISTCLDFSDPIITTPLYTLFTGISSSNADDKISPCSIRVRQKLFQYLIKSHGKGIHTVQAIQVVFEGLYGEGTNEKCKVLALRFCQNLIKDGSKPIIERVSKVLLTGLSKLIGRESTESNDVQNAAYSNIAELARICPHVINIDLKILISYFNHLSTAPPDLQSSIKDALIAMAPAFAWNFNLMETEISKNFVLNSQHYLLLAMLADNVESKLSVVQNVTSFFLTTCFPEYFAPARYLLLITAGLSTSLHENIMNSLYGAPKKDNINYNLMCSKDHPCQINADELKKKHEEIRTIMLPSFKDMIDHIAETDKKRILNSSQKYIIGKKSFSYIPSVQIEVLYYLRICFWFSSGARGQPGSEKFTSILKEYITANYKDEKENAIKNYLKLINNHITTKRDEYGLLCLYDLLNAAPEVFASPELILKDSLSLSLKDVSETTRNFVAQIYGLLLGYALNEEDFNQEVSTIISSISNLSLEGQHGWILTLGHAFYRHINCLKSLNIDLNLKKWDEFIKIMEFIVKSMCDQQYLILTATVKSLSLIGKITSLPDLYISNDKPQNFSITVEANSVSLKAFLSEKLFSFLRNSSSRPRLREESAICLSSLAIGDRDYYIVKNLEGFLSMIKSQKDPTLNIGIAQAIVSTINGYDVNNENGSQLNVETKCDDKTIEWFLNALIKIVTEPNPNSRQSTAVWLLALVKHCSHQECIKSKRQMLQFAFIELLSDESEFIQDVASRGLGLLYSMCDLDTQNKLSLSLLDQLIGGKKKVNKVEDDTEIFQEGVLGKTPTGGNMTTYKELCSLASDLNQPEMIYQFMQLANHNSAWTSKLGAALGLRSISKEAKSKMQPYLGKIIPKLYRYKYDPTPKVQNSMISIWDSIVEDSKETIETYYWDIFKEILNFLTAVEWRVRISCCLAVRDLIKRPNGLKLRIQETIQDGQDKMETDDVPEPELKELWAQLFRVMDDIHEGTRLAAQGTVNMLSKICVTAASNHSKSGYSVAASILPLLLDNGIIHSVPEVRAISIKTISELIDSCGPLVTPHLVSLIPCLLRATGETETPKLSYLSTRLGADSEAQEAVDTIRAEATKSNHSMESIAKCVRHIDYSSLESMTPSILEIMKTTMNLGTKIACAHFICLLSVRFGKEMTPLVSKYLATCFYGLKDNNHVVRKYYASAIGHLVGLAKEQSIKNLFGKFMNFYEENSTNKGMVLAIQSITKRWPELLKDYSDDVLPLIFIAKNEEINEQNKNNIELWNELWVELSPGDIGIKMILPILIPVLQKFIGHSSWVKKVQAANAIKNIAERLNTNLDIKVRYKLFEMLFEVIPGRTFDGKERLLQAIAWLCKGVTNNDEICEKIINNVMKECRKEEPQYRIHALKALGDILETLQIDRFEEVYDMVWHILGKSDLSIAEESIDDDNLEKRSIRAQVFNNLKETVCETLGKAWPVNSIETQQKYQIQFVERCIQCLKCSTRQVQVSLLIALRKFLDRLKLLDCNSDDNKEKKVKLENDPDNMTAKICEEVLSGVFYASKLPHTGLKKESLDILLILTRKLCKIENKKFINNIKKCFEENAGIFEKDQAPEVRCRLKDLESLMGSL